ncbi:hypothetical protein ZEAMMB73_Zm00001d044219 [Zea mays]|jgi:hypothetical protein|uniref:Uncharacterized protein n=1 Tax=Zea mays TaxID=4577 RepID=A0A1D6NJM4_MAIZE|nr:hypothetical protein ZEAMMB73_Zm00001d044219 [Zea mays]
MMFFLCICFLQDLLLGVADLHSEQAVEAAEATINGRQTSEMSFACSSSDSEDDSDDSDEDADDKPVMSDKDNKCKSPDDAEMGPAKGKKPNKRQKIVVLN